MLLGNDVVYWVLTKTARSQLAEAFDARQDLTASLTAEEAAFVGDLIDGFAPASRRMVGVANEGAAVDPEAVYDLEAIQAPSLIIHARDDRLNPFAIAGTLQRRIPNTTLIAFDDGGHLLLGHHAELRRAVAQFLRPNPGL